MLRSLVLLLMMFGIYAGSMVNLVCFDQGWASCRFLHVSACVVLEDGRGEFALPGSVSARPVDGPAWSRDGDRQSR